MDPTCALWIILIILGIAYFLNKASEKNRRYRR